MIAPKTQISIDGETLLSFEDLSLTQRINDHHFFELSVDQEIIEKAGGHTIDKSKAWLGKSILITFDEKEFLGIITNVRLAHSDGHNGLLIVSGYSNTILLESEHHLQSWLEKDLSSVIQDTVDAAGVLAEISPVDQRTFEYQAQYAETHFEFIQRLAKQHNEWLYYDGLKLIFGKPQLENAIEIEYGRDMSNIDISIKAIPSKRAKFSYNSLSDKKEQSKTKDAVTGLNELGDFAFNVSKDIFGIIPNQFSTARVSDKNQIDNILKNKQASKVSVANVLSGKSNKQGLTVGSVIKVSSGSFISGSLDVKNYGKYIITNISHYATGLNSYTNEFEAIAAGVEVLPEPMIELPIAQPQMAVVVSNEDPEQKGRVQVKFQWQTDEMKTSWLQVMSPDAGASDIVGVNRGMVHIPEVDDTVMVGFRYNDPNRPFVMGSMFTGTTAAGGGDTNKTKSITTRSGSTITFDDEKGDVLIKDADNNLVVWDGEGNIAISANESITLSCGKASITLLEDGTIIINGVEIAALGSTSVVLGSGETNSVSVASGGGGSVDVGSNKINLNASTEANIHANAKTTVSATGKVALQGAMVSLN